MKIFLMVKPNGAYSNYGAYIDEEKAKRDAAFNHYDVAAIDLPFIEDHVYYMIADYGYSYGFMSMHDNVSKSHIYPSIDSLKTCNEWRELIDKADKYEKTNGKGSVERSELQVVSLDKFGIQFICGEFGEGFNAKIKRIKVI